MDYNHMLVIGLDGACWPLINDWVEEGDLPNIKKLRDDGLYGDLESSVPPITCPAWKCYSTGKNPGKLGVYWWNEIDFENKQIRPAYAGKFKSKEIWDYLNELGLKTGIIGMPLTFPPKKVDGFMISGGLDAGTKNYAYPKEIERYLDEIGYKVHPEKVFAGKIRSSGLEVEEILNIIEAKFDIAEELIDKYNVHFLQITSFYINSPLQHFFYKDDPVKRAWKIVDQKIGRISDRFNYVLIMSDHGTSELDKNVYLNAWLKREGYLKRQKTISDTLKDYGVTIQRVANILDSIKLKNFLSKIEFFRNLGEKLPEDSGLRRGLGGESTLEGINWNKTKAIALPQGPVYIVDKKNYEKIREEIIEKLKGLKDPETKKNFFQDVYKREDIYSGEYLDKAPDILALDSDCYHNRGGLLLNNITGTSEWKGNNAKYGIFLINGPDVNKGRRIDNFTIYDLAPLILKLFDIEIPKELDGDVRQDIFNS